jgi:hypothetical protein
VKLMISGASRLTKHVNVSKRVRGLSIFERYLLLQVFESGL